MSDELTVDMVRRNDTLDALIDDYTRTVSAYHASQITEGELLVGPSYHRQQIVQKLLRARLEIRDYCESRQLWQNVAGNTLPDWVQGRGGGSVGESMAIATGRGISNVFPGDWILRDGKDVVVLRPAAVFPI